jgi:uncharacterized protein YyaL (SSP411 family)
LRYWAGTVQCGEPDRQAETAALFTLRKMALGGVYDQLGGGFYRYSVDAEWQIPHFEKMLYDNGPLLGLYVQAWRATQDPLFRAVAEETGEWVIREMQAPDGGYYATLDADSEGEEGKFYLWTLDQVQALLDAEEYAVVATRYGLNLPPNFEHRAWHLRVVAEESEAAPAFRCRCDAKRRPTGRCPPQAVRNPFATGLARPRRENPDRLERVDDPGHGRRRPPSGASGFRELGGARPGFYPRPPLARWALAGGSHGWPESVERVSGRPCFSDRRRILELLQCRWRDGDLDFALALAEALLDRFEDREAGGFFFTSDDHERLIQRPKPAHDDALPAGNGIAAQVLLKLGHLTGRTAYLDAAERTLRWARPTDRAAAHRLQCAADGAGGLSEARCKSSCCAAKTAALEEWRERCVKPYAPRRLTLAIPAAAVLTGLLAERRSGTAPVTAYICGGLECLPPITTPNDLERELARTEISGP